MKIQEGPNDPHIFKVIFMAGIPGSGKTTISKSILAGTGLKNVDFDDITNKLKKNPDQLDSQNIVDKKLALYIRGRLGLLIDKTSQNYNAISKLKTELETLGYDTMMVYVNTDLQVARERIKQRYKETGRNVTDDYLDTAFKNLSRNLGKYQQDFGRNFIIVDNSDSTNLNFLLKKVGRFLTTPPKNGDFK